MGRPVALVAAILANTFHKTSAIHAPSSDVLEVDVGHPNVAPDSDFRLLILQRSRYVNLMSRLVPNSMSWIKLLGPKDHVVTVVAARGQRPELAEVFPPELGLFEADCEDSHDLMCVSAEAHRKVLPIMNDFDAMYVVDDDVYLYPPTLKKALRRQIALAKRDGSQEPLAFGMYGCSAAPKDNSPPLEPLHGFCGGAGFGLSQAGAFLLMQIPLQGPKLDAGNAGGLAAGTRIHESAYNPADGYVNSFLQTGQDVLSKYKLFVNETNPREDLVIGSTWKRAGLKVVPVDGVYAWTVNDKDVEHLVHSCSPEPVLFHYADDVKKARLHVEFDDYNDGQCQSALLQLLPGTQDRPSSWYADGRQASTRTCYDSMVAAYIAANGHGFSL
eukprot:TRINITY_DN19110_c0_g1_i1.p1 TRINITY_DN19110_c0_g1~~TRINITY_DN19110_c0_g1_i1.p1  ORF type:complete len:386 (+),score=70.94 TRINITY_DN19110_c0_g1_i1:154-1311(+)